MQECLSTKIEKIVVVRAHMGWQVSSLTSSTQTPYWNPNGKSKREGEGRELKWDGEYE